MLTFSTCESLSYLLKDLILLPTPVLIMNLWAIVTASVTLQAVSGFQGTLTRSGFTRRYLLHAAELDKDHDQGTSIVEKCFEAFNRRDLDGVVDCFTDDCQYEDTMFEGKAVGKQGVRRSFERALHSLLPFNVVTWPATLLLEILVVNGI